MQMKVGTTRAVLLLPSLGVAVKFPRIKFFSCIRFFWLFRHDRYLWVPFFTGHTHEAMSLRWRLFRGIQQNWVEYRFYRQTRNPFAWPTHFSLLGLINVQTLGLPAGVTPIQMWYVVTETLSEGDRWDPHTFGNPENFCRDSEGKVYLLDYGSEESRYILSKYGTELQERLRAD